MRTKVAAKKKITPNNNKNEETKINSKKRKAKISFGPNKKLKNTKSKKHPRDEFTGSFDSAIKMLRDNCNLLEHMEELDKTPFRHIFRLIAEMKGEKDLSWCKRYNSCMRQIVESYSVEKETIKVGGVEIEVNEDKVRNLLGIVDGSIIIDIDKKKVEETKESKAFILRCFSEKKKAGVVTRKRKSEPEEEEQKEDVNESENDKEERELGDQTIHLEKLCGKDLYTKLTENKLSSSDFARVATLYLLTCVFTPTLGISCPTRNLHFVGNMENMCNYNWSRAILDSLNKGLERNKEKNGTKSGCVILLAYCLCEELKLIKPLNASFPRFARWDLKQLHRALKKTKLSDVNPARVVGYTEPGEEERRLLRGEMSAAKVVKTSCDCEIAKLKRELEEALKKERESLNKILENLKRENQSLRSDIKGFALQLEEYKSAYTKNDAGLEECEEEEENLQEDGTLIEKENEDNQKLEGCKEEENLQEDETMIEKENEDNQK